MKLKLLRGLKDIKENFSYHTDTPVSEIALEIKNKKIGAVPIVDNENNNWNCLRKRHRNKNGC